jgi:hypothetical protein
VGSSGFSEVARCYTIGAAKAIPGATFRGSLIAKRILRKEIDGLQAGAADQGAIDVGDRHQLGGVRGLDGTAIQDADPSALGAEPAAQRFPYRGMDLLDIPGRRGEPGSDRPDRLIGHHQVVGARSIRQRMGKLVATNLKRLTGVALPLGLPDADDGQETGSPDRLRLLTHQGVALAMVGAAFGMADDNCAGAGVRKHFGREIAGMGAGRLGVAVLRPNP